mgnify:CR=1 FL=1
MGSPMTPIQVVDSERTITLKESEIRLLISIVELEPAGTETPGASAIKNSILSQLNSALNG